MDALSSIQQAKSVDDIRMLLTAMGQKAAPETSAASIQYSPAEAAAASQSTEIGKPLIDNPMSMDQVLRTLGGAARKTDIPSVETNVYAQILKAKAAEAADARAGAIIAATLPYIANQDKSIEGAAPEGISVKTKAALPDPRNMQKPGDTSGGAARVNARTAEHGVTALTDKDGRVTLTNIGADGKPTPQSIGTPVAGTSRINELLTQLRSSEDVAVAQPLADQLRSSIMSEQLRMEEEANKFAEAEVKLPDLRKALTAQQSLDMTRPGIGMSPASVALQNQISAAERIAQDRSREWLSRNIPYQQLKLTATSASEAIDLAIRKKASFDERVNLKQLAADQKQEQKQEEARIAYAGLTPHQQQTLIELNPALGGVGKEAEAIAFARQQATTSKEFSALISADNEADQNELAFAGNKLALQLLVKREASNTGRPEKEVAQEMESLISLPLTDKELKAYAKATGATRSDQFKEFQGKYNALTGPGATKEQAAEAKFMQAKIRQTILAQSRMASIFNGVSNWAPAGSALQAAAQKAKEVKGQDDLQSSLTVLLTGKSLEEQTAIIREIETALQNEAGKYSKSSVAKVDMGKVLQEFRSITAKRGVLDISSLLKDSFAYGGVNAPTMGALLIGKSLYERN